DDVVIFEFATIIGHDRNAAVFVQDDVVAVFELHNAQVVVTNGAVVLGLDLRLLEHSGRCSTDVERTHGELRAGFADGLGGDDAGGFAKLDQVAGREVAAVAKHADAVFAFAREHGTNFDFLHAAAVDGFGLEFVNFVVRLDQQFLRVLRVLDVIAGITAYETIGEFHDFIFAFIDGLHPNAVAGAAIMFANDHVLCHVHQLAGHVTRVGGLERGIGQTFAGAVRGDEVLQHGQTFAEVGQNRFLDDVAAGLGHKTTHAGELTHLLAIATGARVYHEEYRIELLFALVLFQSFEHDVRNLIRRVGPNIDDLVVAFAGGDDTFAMLLLDFLDLRLGVLDFLIFFVRNDHVVDADGDTGLRRVDEAEFFQFVEHDDRLVVATNLVATPDEVAEFALLDDFVRETHFGRPDFAEENAANGGHDHFV